MEPPSFESPPVVEVNSQPTGSKWPQLIGILAILVIVGAGVFYFVGRESGNPIAGQSPFPSTNPSAVIQDSGVTWLNQPKPLSDVGLFTIDPLFDSSTHDTPENRAKIKYFQVGNDNGRDIIIVLGLPSISGPPIFQFLKIDDMHYQYMTAYSPEKAEGENGPTSLIWTAKVSGTNPKIYQSLEYQPTLDIKSNIKITANPAYSGSYLDVLFFGGIPGYGYLPNWLDYQFPTAKDPLPYAQTPYGMLYLFSWRAEGGLELQALGLKRPNNTYVVYNVEAPFVSAVDGVPQVTWADGTKNKLRYFGEGDMPYVLPDSMMSDLHATGRASTGEQIYEFTNANNPVVQHFFELARTFTSEDRQPATVSEFLAKHGLFVYRDTLGRLALFIGGPYELAP